MGERGAGNAEVTEPSCGKAVALHSARYLAAYERRYNRRFDLKENLVRQARVAAKTEARPYRSIAAVRAPVAEMTG